MEFHDCLLFPICSVSKFADMVIVDEEEILRLKDFVDFYLPEEDGFESYLFQAF